MIKKIFSVAVCSFLLTAMVLSQETSTSDAFTSPIITDEMTIDPEQNKLWRMGQYKYSAKPKNAWEIGLGVGHYTINGDVDTDLPGGFGIGVHLRKAINYVFSIRADLNYSKSCGYDARAHGFQVLPHEKTYNQNYNEPATSAISDYVSTGQNFHRNYQTQIILGDVQAIVNIGNLLFHRERNKWNLYSGMGMGIYSPNVKVDLLDANGEIYPFDEVTDNLDYTVQDDRKQMRKNLKDLLDGDFETPGGIEKDLFTIAGDWKTIIPAFTWTVGISRKFSKRLNITLEHKALLSDNDFLDGFNYRTPFDETNNLDVGHWTNVRLNFNLGDFDQRTEPLYWLNPIDGALNDIAQLKQRPVLDLTDSDADGVIDMFDQELDSEPGCLVDTRGITLDSDGDGLADCKDKEPFSPPGYEIDEEGVAIIPTDPYMTEADVNNIINNKLTNIRTNWFLPMIHFDLDKYYIKPEFFGQLHQVATVMKMHPELVVVTKGHTDVRMPNDYNRVLSYNRANAAIQYLVDKYDLPRDRFLLMYGGEDTPLIDGLADNHRITREDEIKQYINRRVEFYIAGPTDVNMDRPEGPEAGKNTPRSSRPGAKYSGNKSSGYK